MRRPETDVSVHLDQVSGAIKTADLTAVVLVGFSYGGYVITEVADRLAERIAHLVFVDASKRTSVAPV
jgi:pimeloyl-ACP methyl ester carboxylesterase